MRTSLNNTKAIDDYLSGSMAPGDALLFQANMILNNDLITDVEYQQHTYAVIRHYGRQKIKQEIAAVQEIMTHSPKYRGFRERIGRIFKNNQT